MKQTSKFYSLLSVVSLTIIAYSVIIYIFPHFYMDDFEIFTIIRQNISSWFYTDPINHYFLSLRPVSYLMLKIDYLLWGTNAVGMKLNALILHFILIFTFLKILVLISRFLKIDIDYKSIAIFTLIFSLNPESSVWIFVINNQTELLGTLFYALAIFTFLKYIVDEPGNQFYLIFYLLLYCISVYAKQQTLHLPLLLIFLLVVFRKRIESSKFKNALIYGCLGVVVMVSVSFLNFNFAPYQLGLNDFIKKPFSAMGILSYSIFPIYTDYIYYFALFNKPLSIVVSLFILLLISSFLIKKKRNIFKGSFGKAVLLFLAGYAIILYPRIYVGYFERINSVVILSVLIFLFVFSKKHILLKHNKIIILSYFILIISALVVNIFNYKQRFNVYENQRNTLVEYLKNSSGGEHVFIACSLIPYLNPYEVYFNNTNSFGNDIKITVLPMALDFISPIFSYNYEIPFIMTSMKGNMINIALLSNKIIMFPDSYSKLYPSVNILLSEKSNRGYSQIGLEFRENNKLLPDAKIIYYDGQKWNPIRNGE